MAVTFVIILLSMAAVTQSIDSTSQSAIAGKQVNSTDAAEAGVQAEINQISNAVTNGATTFACPLSTTVAGKETYTLKYAYSQGTTPPPSNAQLTTCSGTLNMPSTSASGTTYLIAVKGSTSTGSTGVGSSVTEELEVYIPPTGNYSQSSLFPDAIFAGFTNTDGGGTTVSEPAGSSYGTYDGLGGSCGSSSSSSSYAGNFNDFSFNPSTLGNYPNQSDEMISTTNQNGTPTSTFTNCSIGGDLDDNGTITFTGGSVGGNIYTGNAPLTISNATVGQSIYALYNETLTNTTVGGNVEGGDFTSNNSTIDGNVYATNANSYETSSGAVQSQAYGNVTINGGVIDGSIYATGLVNITNATVKGSIYENCTGTTNSTSSTGGCEVYFHDPTNNPSSVYINGNVVTNSTVPSGTFAIVNAATTVLGGTEYAAGAIRIGYGNVTTANANQNDTSLPANPSPPTATALTAIVNTDYTGYGYGNSSPCTSTSAAGSAQVVSDPSLAVYGQATTPGAGCSFFPEYYYPSSQYDQAVTVPQSYTLGANVNANGHGSRVDSATVDSQSVAAPNNVVFPALTYDANAWPSDPSFCNPPSGESECVVISSTNGTSCNVRTATTPANAICEVTINDCSKDVYYNGASPAISPLDAILDNMEELNTSPASVGSPLPTVINTSCEFYRTGALKLYNNLAIFDTQGFAFVNSAVSSGDGQVHQFFAIVPSSPTTTYSSASALSSSSLAAAPTVSSNTSPPTSNMATCTVNSVTDGPDIGISGNLTDSNDLVQDFLYTPETICLFESGTSAVSGKLYAGYQTSLTDSSGGSLTDTLTSNTANLNPWFGTSTQSAPTVTFIDKSAGS